MCPNCGHDESKSTLVAETSFRQAEHVALMLRRFGDMSAAIDVLTRWAAVRIANILRLKRECLACGIHYDD